MINLEEPFYYSSDKKFFTSKRQAVQYKKNTGKNIYFYYYDHVFSNIDWTTEPSGTLADAYKDQCQRIRDSYEYVILFYSGGADSTNILETFYYNNIKIDKIVCVGAFNQDTLTGTDDNHNAEIYHNCIPYLNDLNLLGITQLCDYSKLFNNVKKFSIYQYGEDWIDNIGSYYSPNNWFWKDVEEYVIPENYKDKKVALIWGKDKTKIINNQFTFSDIPMTSYGGFTKFRNTDRINFYWDYTNPLLLVKQVHTLVNNALANIYNLKRPLSVLSPKSPNKIISLRDNFLMKHKNSEIFDFYNMGVQKILKEVNHTDPIFTESIILSRNYNIVK